VHPADSRYSYAVPQHRRTALNKRHVRCPIAISFCAVFLEVSRRERYSARIDSARLHRRECQRFLSVRRPREIHNVRFEVRSAPASKYYREAIPAISLSSPRPRRRCSYASGQLSSGNDGEGRRTFVGPNLVENMKHFGTATTSIFSSDLAACSPPTILGFGGSHSSPDTGQRKFHQYQSSGASTPAQWRL
jgi:hypothetical protein